MLIIVGVVAAVLAVGGAWLVALLVAERLFAKLAITVRAVAAYCLVFWGYAWLFEVLALTGLFRFSVVTPMVVVAPLAGIWFWRKRVGETLARVGHDIGAEMRELARDLWQHRWIAIGLGLIGIHVLVRMARTLATPSFGWDDFTYHLYRAGRWVQSSGISLEPAPDAWTYYEFFPWGGDLVWAWALVWRAGDGLIPFGAIGLWLGVLLAGYAVARQLGQGRSTALIVSSAIAVLPSQISQISTAYVDNAVLAMVLAASLFLLVLLQEENQGAAGWLLGASCGLGLLVKMSFLPLLAVALVLVVWLAARRRRWTDLVAFAAGMSVVLPNLLFNWFKRGSPFYPFEIAEFLPYNEQHSWILSKYGEGATPAELFRAARSLVVNDSSIDPFLNLGLLGVMLLTLGVIGSILMARSGRSKEYLVWAYAGAAITVLTFFDPRNSSMFVLWTITMGRLLIPSLSPLLILGGLVPDRVVRALILPLMVGEYFLHARLRWPAEMTVATLKAAAILLVLAAAYLLSRKLLRGRRGAWLVPAIGGTMALVAIGSVRSQWRWDAYRLHGDRALFDWHGVPPVQMWPMWREVDQADGYRIAVTAGFDGQTGHNWFRWPFLGTRLQNEVLYIPVTPDGELVSYFDRDELVEQADRRSWLDRLGQENVDRVAALGPANIEHRWILDLPEIFPLEITMAGDNFLLARVDREALAAHLSHAD